MSGVLIGGWWNQGEARDSAGAPTNVKTIIAARLDQLPAPERQVILDASVVGDFFWQGTLEALGGGEALADTLVALERRGLLRRSQTSRIGGDQELVFKHSLVREVAYDTLPKAARRERHEVVARFIEQSAGDPAPYAAVLAHHWREAGDAAHAADWLITAADQAGRGWAPREGIDLCTQALALIPEDDAERRRRARLRRAVLATAELHATVDLAPGNDQSKSAGEMSPPIS